MTSEALDSRYTFIEGLSPISRTDEESPYAQIGIAVVSGTYDEPEAYEFKIRSVESIDHLTHHSRQEEPSVSETIRSLWDSSTHPDVERSTLAISSEMLHGKLGDGFVATLPIPLLYEFCDDGGVVASDPIFHMYGEGKDRQEAREDYISSLKTFYGIVECHSGESEEKANHLAELRLFIHRG